MVPELVSEGRAGARGPEERGVCGEVSLCIREAGRVLTGCGSECRGLKWVAMGLQWEAMLKYVSFPVRNRKSLRVSFPFSSRGRGNHACKKPPRTKGNKNGGIVKEQESTQFCVSCGLIYVTPPPKKKKCLRRSLEKIMANDSSDYLWVVGQ